MALGRVSSWNWVRNMRFWLITDCIITVPVNCTHQQRSVTTKLRARVREDRA